MKCLITGGLGFIGYYLAQRLSRDGHAVVILDPGERPSGMSPGTELIWGDTSCSKFLAGCLRGVDVVFHFAGSLLPNDSNRNPGSDVSQTLVGNIALIQSAVETGVKKFVFASSGGTVYGIPEHSPVSENHATDPISSYGIVKLTTEKYLALFERLHGLQFAALRYSNVYGEGQNPFRNFGAVASFLGAIAREQEIQIWGDGTAVRDFIHVEDAVEATVCAATYAGPRRIFNIGSGYGTSINQLLATVERVTGRSAAVKYLPKRDGDVPAVILNILRARQEFGWNPGVSLEEGVKRTWEWCERSVLQCR